MSAPVNFRTSPPLEALKPHRGHIIQRSTTPLILTESGRGLEHIRISSSSSISSTTSSLSSLGGASVGTVYGGGIGGLPTCDSPAAVLTSSGLSNHHQQQQQNSSNTLALLSTTNTPTGAATPGGASPAVGMPFIGQESAIAVANMEISRSVSPPAKVFHCAVSPRRRQSRHQQQRVPRPHRPCLDFDKMQQLKARSVTTWRHSNEHSGELSVFCWWWWALGERWRSVPKGGDDGSLFGIVIPRNDSVCPRMTTATTTTTTTTLVREHFVLCRLRTTTTTTMTNYECLLFCLADSLTHKHSNTHTHTWFLLSLDKVGMSSLKNDCGDD